MSLLSYCGHAGSLIDNDHVPFVVTVRTTVELNNGNCAVRDKTQRTALDPYVTQALE